MKKIKFFIGASLCLLLPAISKAQTDSNAINYTPDKTFTENMDYLFAHLDKSKITTGIFNNRVMPITHLDLVRNNVLVSEAYFWKAYN